MIASLSFPEAKIKKLVEFASDLAEQDSVVLATLQKIAGKLSYRQAAIMGRFGRAALKPAYELIAKGG